MFGFREQKKSALLGGVQGSQLGSFRRFAAIVLCVLCVSTHYHPCLLLDSRSQKCSTVHIDLSGVGWGGVGWNSVGWGGVKQGRIGWSGTRWDGVGFGWVLWARMTRVGRAGGGGGVAAPSSHAGFCLCMPIDVFRAELVISLSVCSSALFFRVRPTFSCWFFLLSLLSHSVNNMSTLGHKTD